MTYRVIIPKPVEKEIRSLPSSIRARIKQRIVALQDNPRPYGCIKLKGYANEYRIRVGDYRIRYEIHDDQLLVILLYCLHRKDVYKE